MVGAGRNGETVDTGATGFAMSDQVPFGGAKAPLETEKLDNEVAAQQHELLEHSAVDAESGENINTDGDDQESGSSGSISSDEESSTDGGSDDDDESEEEEESAVQYADDEEAERARAAGVEHYNSGRYEEAAEVQYHVVRYFSRKYGPTSAKCGLYFLDYGLSQLRILQRVGQVVTDSSGNSGENSCTSVSGPVFHGDMDLEGLKSCFVNLDVARVSFQKLEAAAERELHATTPGTEGAWRAETGFAELQLRIAEVHNALAQVNMELEETERALMEYEGEILVYRGLQQSLSERECHATGAHRAELEALQLTTARRLTSAMYGVADCHIKSGNFEEAEKRAQETLTEALQLPEGLVAPEVIEDLRDMVADARESKNGKFENVLEQVRQQFAPEEAERQPTAVEFYQVGSGALHAHDPEAEVSDAADGGRTTTVAVVKKKKKPSPGSLATADEPLSNPFLTAIPGSCDGAPDVGDCSRLSMPCSMSYPFSGHENSNSQSLSLFPPQGGSLSQLGATATNSGHGHSSGTVQRAVARKHAKRTSDGSGQSRESESVGGVPAATLRSERVSASGARPGEPSSEEPDHKRLKAE